MTKKRRRTGRVIRKGKCGGFYLENLRRRRRETMDKLPEQVLLALVVLAALACAFSRYLAGTN